MHPDFFSLGPFTIHTYGVMMALGFLAGLGNWIVLGRREGHSAQFCTDLMFWVMVSGIAGARTAYVLENWQSYAEAPMTIFRVDQGGLIFYGGLVASGVAIAIFARRHRLGLASLFDFALTSVPLAHALGRVGCFLNGCCYGGLASSGGCGVQFPKTSIPWVAQVNEGLIGSEASSSLAVHPVQLYEAGFNVLVYGLMVWMFRRRLRPGMLMAVYLMLYAVGRFTLEYWRGDRGERLAVGFLSIGQFVSVLAFILGLSLLVALQARRSKEASHD